MNKMVKDKVAAVVVLGILSAGNIAFAESGIWNVSGGKEVNIASLNADAYGVTRVGEKSDGSHVVQAVMAGFQSDVEVAVTFAADGSTIQSLSIVNQAETDGIGSQVTNPSFTDQFAGVQAPVMLNGKDGVETVSPVTSAGADGVVAGDAAGAGNSAGAETDTAGAAGTSEDADAAQLSNPAEWNPQDQSPEANAVRAMYGAGLTGSAAAGQPLDTSVADYSPEDHAVYKMTEAGLMKSAEEEAAAEETIGAAAQGTPVDAVSGATISSTAVANAVNHAYYFLKEEVSK